MKRGIILVFSIFLIIILCNNVIAIVGVSPGRYDVNFEPGLKKEFTFNFIFDPGVESEVYAEGYLADYVKLNRKSLVGGGAVIASLKLPSDIEVPGPHAISIGARQTTTRGSGVSLVGNVKGLIIVKVPYPGKYLEIHLRTTNANAGDPIDFTVLVNNLGKEDVTAIGIIEIYDSQDNHIETLNLGIEHIETTQSVEFSKQLDTSNYKAGDYKAVAIVKYGDKTAEAERDFRLGRLYVGISNSTKELEKDKINRFEVQVESFWNDPISNVYSNISVLGYSIASLTPSITLNPWSKSTLTAFFDTSSIKENKFQANITVFYGDKQTSEIVDLRFKGAINYVLLAIIGGLALVIVLVVIIVILLRRNKKSGSKKK